MRDLANAADQIKFARGAGLQAEAERHTEAVREMIRATEQAFAPAPLGRAGEGGVMDWAGYRFQDPLWLWALLLGPILVAVALPSRAGRRGHRLPGASRLRGAPPRLAGPPPPSARWCWPPWPRASRPWPWRARSTARLKEDVTTQGVDIVVALDVSGSMAAQDFQPRNRLVVAKEVVAEFVKRRPTDRVGLVVFAGKSLTKAPPTTDTAVLLRQLEDVRLEMLPDGTAIGSGLATSLTRLRRSKAKSKVVVLVTDGANNAGEIDPATATDLAKAMEVRVYTVLVGTGGQVPMPVRVRDPFSGQIVEQTVMTEVQIDEEPAASGSRSGPGGEFFRATDSASLRNIFDRIDKLEKSEIKQTAYRRYRELLPAVPARRGRGLRGGRRRLGGRACAWPRSRRHGLRVAPLALRPPGLPLVAALEAWATAGATTRGWRASWRGRCGRACSSGGPAAFARLRLALMLLGAAGLVLALARPQWGIVREKVEREGVDVVLALDTSGSMATEDVPPNRFFLARAALSSLVARLEGDRFGLLAFEGEAYPLVPLTLDADAVGLFLETVEPGIVPAPAPPSEWASLEASPCSWTRSVTIGSWCSSPTARTSRETWTRRYDRPRRRESWSTPWAWAPRRASRCRTSTGTARRSASRRTSRAGPWSRV